ncbi:MAG: hypothetical protein RLZZ436_4657 [Planctomycetota bacterium]
MLCLRIPRVKGMDSDTMKRLIRSLCVSVMAALSVAIAAACPFCLAPPQTFSAQFLLTDFAVVAELQTFEVLQKGTVPVATFRIRQLLSGDPGVAARCGLLPGRLVTREAEAGAQPGSLYLLYGDLTDVGDPVSPGSPTAAPATFSSDSDSRPPAPAQLPSTSAVAPLQNAGLTTKPLRIEWTDHVEISAATAEYLRRLPRSELPVPERLAWYLTHLESPDPAIAGDAWAEFGIASYADVKTCRALYSAARLRGWIADPKISPERIGLYGLMLGLCGQPEDAEFLRNQMLDSETGEFRFGAEGLLAGYLLLTGETGLGSVEARFLQPETLPAARHALLQTLDFFHTYEPDLIPRNRLCSSARLLLRDPVLAEMTVMSLSRWQDWQSMRILEQLFDEVQQSVAGDQESLQRCILQFAQHCSRAGRPAVGPEVPPVDPATAEFSGLADRFLKRVAADRPELLRAPKSEFQAPGP